VCARFAVLCCAAGPLGAAISYVWLRVLLLAFCIRVCCCECLGIGGFTLSFFCLLS
jgi:hypothetical protein